MTTKAEPEIKRGQRWLHRNTGNEARVMGVVELYVVARYKGCAPWIRSEFDFRSNFISPQEFKGNR